MSSIQLCAAHQATSGFDGDAIVQYMRTDFITLQEHLSVHEAREHFISQLASDDIPGQVFCRRRQEAAWQPVGQKATPGNGYQPVYPPPDGQLPVSRQT
ncbi:magnesium transporter [Klebsiella pneumoniae]|nr:magnesium transporter [Klebsiella pneumoniae]